MDREAERKLGVDLFNHVWTLLEATKRTAEQVDAMIHAAHASAHHWRQVGAPENFALPLAIRLPKREPAEG